MRICVFSGSSKGRLQAYDAAAMELAEVLSEARIGLVYGGASIGLMGTMADALLARGGEVIGVMPRMLVDKEVAHRGLSDLRVVASMHERKALMADLADAFIALPGGIGTMEELFEVWTWAHLGYHQKPCGVLNVAGYYDRLMAFLDTMVEDGFLKTASRRILLVERRPADMIDAIQGHQLSVGPSDDLPPDR